MLFWAKWWFSEKSTILPLEVTGQSVWCNIGPRMSVHQFNLQYIIRTARWGCPGKSQSSNGYKSNTDNKKIQGLKSPN